MTDSEDKQNLNENGANESEVEATPKEQLLDDSKETSGEKSESDPEAVIAALQEESKKNYSRLLRTAADFENYKKRSKKELGDSVQRAEKRVVLDFLPVADNLKRAIEHINKEGDQGNIEGLIEGVQMVQRQFLNILEQYEIKPFDSMGEVFDPEKHEAVQQVASDLPRNTIVSEVQKGYMRGDKLIRPAMVFVSMGNEKENSSESSTCKENSDTTESGDKAEELGEQ